MVSMLLLAQAQPRPPGLGDFIFPIVLVCIMIYFISVKPQRKREKEHQEMLRKLRSGDRVVTTGGIHGTVATVKDESVILKVADNVKLEFSLKSIAGKVTCAADDDAAADDGKKKKKK